ncbi:hypothetical protein BpJC7_20500 [Weizmannia acidilactici]|uniref:DUF1798 family protein n=1 Tax=Weizmannia acidilactici TaxID=2607726 RepID=A0A5J4JK71_9BACI|nr:YppE family protein [Weizmannia acidilactici]GER67887.1 hypothetical protein BpJC4_23580 [Weizmannia acidilactici]GER70747.1 hypothetical protein BpJC7_20500 [Weizmannia acidilactici]GER73730.1 hypothetical protein BpPP18_17970 [Weizmannia acidilactici]
MELRHLIDLNRQLIEYTEQLSNIYHEVKETGEEKDFFSEVKPFCDRLKEVIDEWLPLAKVWVAENRPKHLFVLQLEHTAENLQMVSVRAFYPSSSRKMVLDHFQSVKYILARLQEELERA